MNDQSDLPPELGLVPVDRLKHGTGRYAHVILVPQPSDSPNDPLNVWLVINKKKYALLIIYSVASLA